MKNTIKIDKNTFKLYFIQDQWRKKLVWWQIMIIKIVDLRKEFFLKKGSAHVSTNRWYVILQWRCFVNNFSIYFPRQYVTTIFWQKFKQPFFVLLLERELPVVPEPFWKKDVAHDWSDVVWCFHVLRTFYVETCSLFCSKGYLWHFCTDTVFLCTA